MSNHKARILKLEQAATMKAKRGPFNLGMLYERMSTQPETLSPELRQLIEVTP